MKISFDISAAYNAFEKLSAQNWNNHMSFEDILDAFDGVFGIIEQSFVGDLGAAYKKEKPFAKWIMKNIHNSQYGNKKWDFYE